MKLSSILAAVTFLMGVTFSASAATITASYLGTSSTMPGSPSDYMFFGNGSQFPSIPHYDGGNPPQPSNLTNFSAAPGSNAGGDYSGSPDAYSFINGPTGSGQTSIATGDLFAPGSAGGDAPDILNITLGTPGSTFDFSNFNIYVMFGNGPGDGNDHITALDLSLYSGATLLASESVPVTDANTDQSLAYFEAFNITGAAAGDVLHVGAASITPHSQYLGGVSFAEAPEPSTCALMLAGLALLGFGLRRKQVRS